MTGDGGHGVRESVWSMASVARGTSWLYFLLFSLQVAVGVVFVSVQEFNDGGGVANAWVMVWERSSSFVITAAATSIIVVEGGGYLMVLASQLEDYLKRRQEARLQEAREEAEERGIEEGMEKGIEKGRQEAVQKMLVWFEKNREALEEMGIEPPPIAGRNGQERDGKGRNGQPAGE